MEEQKEQKQFMADLKGILTEVKQTASKLKVSRREALALTTHRELLILNAELQRVHGVLDLIYSKIGKSAEANEEKA